MADKHFEADQHSEKASYELDLDDTISAWDQVVEEAVAAVEKRGEDVRSVIESETGEEETQTESAAGADEAPAAEEPAYAEDAAHAEDAAAAGEAAEEERATEAVEAAATAADDDTQVRNLRDQLVRTLADFDNFRKRTEREKATAQRYALFDVLKDFLGVFDNLERALAASGSADDLKTGVQMIARQFSDLLGRHGVEEVLAVGQVFDPTVHEAVTREESGDVTEPTVKAELQRGYRLHDRLLRPALVTVAMPPPSPPKTEEPEEDSVEEAAVEAEARDDAGSADEAGGAQDNEATPGEQVAEATEVS